MEMTLKMEKSLQIWSISEKSSKTFVIIMPLNIVFNLFYAIFKIFFKIPPNPKQNYLNNEIIVVIYLFNPCVVKI